MAVEIRRGTGRFLTRAPGRQTRHSFSFGQHYDPARTGLGPLVVHDEHTLGSGAGFEEHEHRDVVAVTWVVAGAVAHRASAGEPAELRPGQVGVLVAGSGVAHEEVAAAGGPARFVQCWLTPDAPGGVPSYAVADVACPPGELVVAASGSLPAPAALPVAGATLRVARLGPGDTVALPAGGTQHAYVARGALVRSSLAEPLSAGDAFVLTDEPAHEVTAAVDSELLVWSLATGVSPPATTSSR